MVFDSEYDGLAWLTLVLQAGGLLAAAAALATFLGRAGRGSIATATAAAAVVVAAALLLPDLRDSFRSARDFHRGNEAKSDAEKRFQCTTQATVDSGFLIGARELMGPGARYHLVASETTRLIDGEFCIRYVMLPATQAPSIDEADWVLFYEDVPREELDAAVERDGRFIVPDPENDPDRVVVELDSDRPGGQELVR